MRFWLFKYFIFLLSPFVFSQEKINQFDENGKRHGIWQKTYPNSDQLRYEGTFEHGKEVGLFKFYFEKSKDQPSATKLFSKDSDSVEAKFFTLKGELVSTGKLVAGKREGKWTYYHKGSDKIMMTEFYINDKLEGPSTTYFDNGKIAGELNYKNGVLHGKEKTYSEDGVLLKEFNYVNGKLNGSVTYYDVSGNISIKGQYKNNLQDGLWKYYRNGKLTEERTYPLPQPTKNKL
ncbi:MAG TPA: hypothetical protein VFM72_03200 [Aequorivita sp.]|nr:hypothetical protein [Aequorivita sp.]